MLASLIAVLTAVAVPPAAEAKPVCHNSAPVTAGASLYTANPDARLRRLDTLPPANLILTVLRREGGCEVPVIVRYGIGDTPAVTDRPSRPYLSVSR